MAAFKQVKETASVPSIRRALAVFDLLANSRRGLTVSEISRRLALPKSSAHRILITLEEAECVIRNPASGRYLFGTRLFSLNRAAIEGRGLREEANPVLQDLMRRTGLTVHMAVLEHAQAVIIEKLSPGGSPNIGTWIGRAMDVHSTGVGKALIAYMPAEELERELVVRTFVRHNRFTITSLSKLKEDLEQVRRRGYAVDNEEDELGIRCIGAPVLAGNKVIAAVSVVGTTEELPAEGIQTMGDRVRRAADLIAARSRRTGRNWCASCSARSPHRFGRGKRRPAGRVRGCDPLRSSRAGTSAGKLVLVAQRHGVVPRDGFPGEINMVGACYPSHRLWCKDSER